LLTIFWDDEGEHVAQGFASIFLLGSVLGLALPRSSHLHGRWYPLISNILGYCYALAWSVSYYPQLILNYKLQSTEGLSVDFCTLSVFGCACYASLNVAMFYSPQIQTLYGKRHDGHASLVQPSDVAFSIHALILSTIWLGQTWYYNRRSFEHHNRVSKTTIALLGVMSAFVIAHGLLIMTLAPCKTVQYWPCDKLNWLDFLYVVTSFKIAITLLSYVPQALLNFSLKSTDGFNIWGMLLDAFGGIFSVLQILLDSWNENDLSGISGDAAKLALALLTIGLDVSKFLSRCTTYGGLFRFCPKYILTT
jgi:cystinosin